MTGVFSDPPDTKLIRALPWPIDLPVLTAGKICGYTSPKPGRKTLWEHISTFFPDEPGLGREMRIQFVRILMRVINASVDPRDKNLTCPSDVPSGPDRQTKAPYSAEEVAAWWNAAVEQLRKIQK